jgi:hypothetical protein
MIVIADGARNMAREGLGRYHGDDVVDSVLENRGLSTEKRDCPNSLGQ